MRRPGRLIFLLALSARRRLEDALKTLHLRHVILRFQGYLNKHIDKEFVQLQVTTPIEPNVC
jgi:hypothetical protein